MDPATKKPAPAYKRLATTNRRSGRRSGSALVYKAFLGLTPRERARFLDRLSDEEDAYYAQVAGARKAENEPVESWEAVVARRREQDLLS